MDIKSEIKNNNVILIVTPGVEYNNLIVDMAKSVSGKNVCYVTLNKTFDSLKELFDKNKINYEKFVFIDGISKTIKNMPDQAKACYFISNPAALTELSLKINSLINHGFEFIVFDSITSLLVYEKNAPVSRFIGSVVAKVRESKVKGLFYALDLKDQENLIQEISMFVDKVVKNNG